MTGRLYAPSDAVMDIQVDCADDPGNAHTKYWQNKTVIREVAEMIRDNAQ